MAAKAKAKPAFIDPEEAENKELSDEVNKIYENFITWDKSKYTQPKAKFDGENINFMFEVIKHYVGYMFATIMRTASSMKKQVKVLDKNIDTIVRMLKRRGIFLTPVASGEEDKITPKLLIKNGHNFIKDLLQKTMRGAPSIDAELLAKRDEVLRHIEEEKVSFATAKKHANAEAASLLAEEKATSNKNLTKKQKKKPGARAGAGAPNAAANLTRMAKEVAAEYNATAGAAARNAEAAAARNAEAKEASARNAEAKEASARNAEAKEAAARNAAANLARMAKEVAAEHNAKAAAARNAEAAAARNAEAAAARNAEAAAARNAEAAAARNAEAAAARNAEAAAARNAEAAAARNAEAAAGAGAGSGNSAPAAGPAAVPAIQHAFHWIMSQIHNAVYSDDTIKFFIARGFKPDDVGTHKLLIQNIIRLYFHGGNSVSWYKTKNAGGVIPYESDFDMVCLINPDLVHFARIRKYFFELIIKTIETIMDDPRWKNSIIEYYAPDKYAETIQFKLLDYNGPMSADDTILFDPKLNEGFTSLISSIRFEPSPVNIQIIPNIVYKDGGTPTQLGVASVKMTTSMFRYGVRPIELFEVTFPSTNYEHLTTLWGFMDLTLAEIDGYTFYVPKPVSLYLEQRIAYEGTPNSLETKKTRRLRRSDNMKRLIRRNYNAGNANIKFELNADVGDYEEPIRSYINEIKA